MHHLLQEETEVQQKDWKKCSLMVDTDHQSHECTSEFEDADSRLRNMTLPSSNMTSPDGGYQRDTLGKFDDGFQKEYEMKVMRAKRG